MWANLGTPNSQIFIRLDGNVALLHVGTWDMFPNKLAFHLGCCVPQTEGSGTSIVPLNTCRAGTIELTVPGTVALADVGGKKVIFFVEPCCTLLVRSLASSMLHNQQEYL